MKNFSKNIAQVLFFIIILLAVDFAFSQDKYKVQAIEIIGNDNYSDQFLKKIFLTKKYNWLNKQYFRNDLFTDDLNALIDFYKDEGYLEAKIINFQIQSDSLERQVALKIEIDEGERTTIAGISFFGNQVFSDSLLVNFVQSSINKPFKKSTLDEDTQNLITFYANHGHFEAIISPNLELNQERHQILVDFNIEEGQPIYIDEIKIRGNKKTKASVIVRELTFKPGDKYNFDKILKSQQKLYLTGLFNGVMIQPDENFKENQNRRDIVIEVDEKNNGEFSFGLGYGTTDRLRGSIELFQNNISGTARQAGISVFASFIMRRSELSFTEPWLFTSRTKADATLFIEKREEAGYHIDRYGGKLTLGKKIEQYNNLSFSYRHEKVKLSQEIDFQHLQPYEKDQTRSLTFTLIRDTRNNIINSTSGTFTSVDIERAGEFLKGTSSFIKLSFKYKTFYPIQKRLIFATALNCGLIGNYQRCEEIPIQERFFSGGASSVRGFKEKFIGPKNEFGNPTGGTILLTLNLFEFRYTFYKKLSTILFLDLGNVWENSVSFKKFNLRKGMGLGLRYNSPLGILRCDYGMKLDRQVGESFGEFYFSVGHAF